MSLSSVKASTQDTSNGTPVAIAAAEAGSGNIQAFALVGHKTTWSETGRTGITTADAPTGGDLTATGFGTSLIDLENARRVRVRATCNTASKTLNARLIFYDGSGNPTGYSELILMQSDATLRLGNATGDFVCQRVLVDVASARKCRLLVTSLDAATTWAVYVQPC